MAKVTFKPLRDMVIVTSVAEVLLGRARASGVIIPDTVDIPMNLGEVVAVGPGRLDANGVLMPMSVAVGDLVLVDGKYGGKQSIDGVEYGSIPEIGIITIVIREEEQDGNHPVN